MRATTALILSIGLITLCGCLARSGSPQLATPPQPAPTDEKVVPGADEMGPIPISPRQASVVRVVEVNRPTPWWNDYVGSRPELESIVEEKGLPSWIFRDVDWHDARVNEACEVVRFTEKADLWVYNTGAERSKVVLDPVTGRVLLEADISDQDAYRLQVGEDGVPLLLGANNLAAEKRMEGELTTDRLRCLQWKTAAAEGQTAGAVSSSGSGRKDIDATYRFLLEEQGNLARERDRLEEERKALEEERKAFSEEQQRLADIWGAYAVGEDWVVDATNLNVRATPTLYGKIITTLPRGSSVRVLRREGPWAQMAFRPSGSPEDELGEGWAASKYLIRYDDFAEEAGQGQTEGAAGVKVAETRPQVPGEMEIRIEPTVVHGSAATNHVEGVDQAEPAAEAEESADEVLPEPGAEAGPGNGAPPSVSGGWLLTAGNTYPFAVHVGTFASADDAEEAVKKWEADGHLTYPVLLRTSEEQSWYRVYLGRFATREDAEVASVKLRHDGKIPYSLPLRVPYALLTGSFERPEDAEEKKILLRVKGLLPYMLPFATDNGTEYRVYVGAYPSEDQAEEEARILRENHTSYTVARF